MKTRHIVLTSLTLTALAFFMVIDAQGAELMGVCDYNTDCAKWGRGQCALDGNGAPKKASIEESNDVCRVTCGNDVVVTQTCTPPDQQAGTWAQSDLALALPSGGECDARVYRAGATDDLSLMMIDLRSLGQLYPGDAMWKSRAFDGAFYKTYCVLGTCDDLVDCATASDEACADMGHTRAMSSELTADGGCSYVCQGGLNGVFVCAEMPEPEDPSPTIID